RRIVALPRRSRRTSGGPAARYGENDVRTAIAAGSTRAGSTTRASRATSGRPNRTVRADSVPVPSIGAVGGAPSPPRPPPPAPPAGRRRRRGRPPRGRAEGEPRRAESSRRPPADPAPVRPVEERPVDRGRTGLGQDDRRGAECGESAEQRSEPRLVGR